MSRAAKKRAKKKNKNKTNESKSAQHSNEQPQSTKRKEQEDVDSHDDDDEKKKRNKKQKTRDRKQEPTKEGIPSNNSHHHQDEDDDEKDENPVDKAVQDVVARLDPAKILLHRPLGKDDETAKILNEDVAVGDLLKEITTRQRAKCLLQSIIGTGLPLEEFYSQYWEKEPLLVQADDDEKTRFDGLMSLSGIRRLLKDQPMSYGKDLNVTRYVESVDGVKRRLTLDQTSEGEFVMADARDVWANFDDGCTVRLLCPHQHNDTVHALLSTLETEWGCMVGANAYLTPPSEAQGFAPHYDDIEAFILQLEGRKRWKVYEPLSKAHVLPRRSSGDYTEQDLKNIEPVLDVVLGPGDLLYMPRGWIHQACTLPTSREHSLHLTVSAMQQWAWIDFLELLVPEALEAAASSETSTSLREGLPRRFLDYMGAIHDQPGDPEELKQLADRQKQENTDQNGTTNAETKKKKQQRESFLVEAKKRIMRVAKEVWNNSFVCCASVLCVSVWWLTLSLLFCLCRRHSQWSMRRAIRWGQGFCRIVFRPP